jgi:hypothetical protein
MTLLLGGSWLCRLLAALFPAVVVGQTLPTHEQRVRIASQDIGRYEAMYGKPMLMSLEVFLELAPQRQTVRTHGTLGVMFGPGKEGNGYEIADAQFRITIVPVAEIADRVEGDAGDLQGQEVEVTLAVDGGQPFFWKYALIPPRKAKRSDGNGTTLDALLWRGSRLEKAPVTVRGQFRGANLFLDLPGKTRRSKSDWVIRDGEAAAWVTGKSPRGEGWALDRDAKSDAAHWVEIDARPEVRDGVLYLKATDVRLLPRAALPEP